MNNTSNQIYISRKISRLSNDILNDMGRLQNYAYQLAYDYVVDNNYHDYQLNDIIIDFSMKYVRFGIIVFKEDIKC